MFLFVDFISNDNKFAYAQDPIKIERNINLISPEFSLEVQSAKILENKNYFICTKGIYIIILKLEHDNDLMTFDNFRLIGEIEKTLLHLQNTYSKEFAGEYYKHYTDLLSNHMDNVGLTSVLE